MDSKPRPLTAADVMTPSPRSCSTFSTVIEAVMIFRDADCGAVPVLDDGKPVGVLTDRDVALGLTEFEETLATRPVSDLMSRAVVSVAPEEGIEAIAEKFSDKAVRRLLVIDSQDQLVGIIAWSDLAPHLPDRRLGRVVSDVVEHA
ncbi:CBS domain-containing protein [Tundrisphaera lichenicola]|uniref:CBS domain-containing protein n=1 Tax=Tundrisphaera lichenicola TaxID=2029860 RepID=UPI003EBBE124